MQTILLIVQVFAAIGIIALVLIQHGKGADAGAAFGGGASSTVFGAQGSGNFLSRMTAILAAVFFAASLALAYYAKGQVKRDDSVIQEQSISQEVIKPEIESKIVDAPPQIEPPGAGEEHPAVPANGVPEVLQ